MELKKAKNNKTKKVVINGKTKNIYCNPNNKRIEYVKHNKQYIKVSDYKKQYKKKQKGGTHTCPITLEEITQKDIDTKKAMELDKQYYMVDALYSWINHKGTDVPYSRRKFTPEEIKTIKNNFEKNHPQTSNEDISYEPKKFWYYVIINGNNRNNRYYQSNEVNYLSIGVNPPNMDAHREVKKLRDGRWVDITYSPVNSPRPRASSPPHWSSSSSWGTSPSNSPRSR